MNQAAGKTSDPRMKALAAATTALSVKNAADAVQAGQGTTINDKPGQIATGKDAAGNPTSRDANAADQAGGIDISLSIGTSKSSSTQTQTSTTASSSHITAGGDINIKATGADTSAGATSDINIIGSQIKANGDVSLIADHNINLQAAENVDTLNGKNKSSSASIGVSVGTSGFLVTASASGGKGKTTGNGTTWTETTVQSGNHTGDTVTLNSGTDTNLIGAQVSGNQVIANVGTNPLSGGNLNIQSLQDTNQYKDKQQSIGGSISVGYGKMGGSVNYSASNTKSNYASVNEQSGIMAGDGGFQVNVNGNTDLKGAVIASTQTAIDNQQNSFTTQTLTVSNIENKAAYKADSMSMSAGVGTNKQTDGSFKNSPTASAGIASDADKSSSVTVSAISGGTINVTGQDNLTTLATLDRDVKVKQTTDAQGNITNTAVDSNGNNLAGTLTPIFDKEKVARELAAQVQITQAFSAVAPKAVGDFATNKMNEINLKLKAAEALNDPDQINALKAELAKWDEGGVYRIGLHAIVGGLTGDFEGAIGALGSQAALPSLIESINKLDIPLELKATLLVGASASIGALIGDTAGAASAFNAVVNNCNAHDCLTQKWDKNSPGYHQYEVKSPTLCNVAEAGCMEAVQHELLSNSAPGQDKPAVIGQVVEQNLTGNNDITQYAPSANMVVNGTNSDHIFNDGYVVRTINVDASGNVTIVTQGEGVNTSTIPGFSPKTMASLNSFFGKALFQNLGVQNQVNVKNNINPQVPK